MRVYDAKNLKFQDKLAEKRRKVWILKILFFVGLSVVIVGFILYLLFFSGLLEIKEVSVNGLDKVDNDKFNDGFNKRLNSKWLGLLEHQKNMFFFDSGAFKAEAFAVFPEIKGIFISKKPPHALDIDVTEREIAGIWCFVDGCKYFDKEGVTWGETTRSSGFLILVVDDLRLDSQSIDLKLVADMMLIYERLKETNILVSKFTVPDNFIGDFNAHTSRSYKLMFSMDSNIKDQLEVLKIFLAEKQKESEFGPQYVDLRINGRVYFK